MPHEMKTKEEIEERIGKLRNHMGNYTIDKPEYKALELVVTYLYWVLGRAKIDEPITHFNVTFAHKLK